MIRPTASAPELDERSREILKFVIKLYIMTGKPVGSRRISKIIDRRLSPATIRNLMADLEEAGYLIQPHTSAGRIPSEKGYRFYVDSSTDSGNLSRSDELYIHRTLVGGGTPEEMMLKASYLLSDILKNVGIVVAPPMELSTLKHIEFVDLTDGKILVVLVSRSGLLQRKLIRIAERFTQEELNRAAQYLVEKFSGKSLVEIRDDLLRMMHEERVQYDRMLANLFVLCRESFMGPEVDIAFSGVYVQGTSNMLNQPEFADIEHMRTLFRMFEEKGRLVKILNECISSKLSGGVKIAIGSEVGIPGMCDITLITSPYYYKDRTIGLLGVLGPTRMEYERGISVVGYVAKVFGEVMSG